MKQMETKGTSRSINGFCEEMLSKGIVWPMTVAFWKKDETRPDMRGEKTSTNKYDNSSAFKNHIYNSWAGNWVKEFVTEAIDKEGRLIEEVEWRSL